MEDAASNMVEKQAVSLCSKKKDNGEVKVSSHPRKNRNNTLRKKLAQQMCDWMPRRKNKKESVDTY